MSKPDSAAPVINE